MKKIEMVDLKSQYAKIKDEVDAKVIEVIESSAFIKGPEVKAFEKELATYLDVKHTIGCANGTDALQLAMMALDLQPGDEVITSNFTYVATAEAIALLKLTPVLVDNFSDDFGINPEEIEKAISPRTKAIVPVHLFGQCADMEAIMGIAKKHNLYVIEDNAQAIGADYTFSDGRKMKAGTIGDIGTTSFFPSKNLGCMGDGGAIFTNNDELAEKLKMVANHGQVKTYYHDFVGINSRLDSIQAAILRIKLRYLDSYCDARRKAADYYDKGFADVNGLESPARVDNSTHVFHQYVLKLDEKYDRDGMLDFLRANDIPCNVYYPVPLNMQKAYAMDVNERGFPVTELLCKTVFALPIHTEFEQEQQDYIIEKVKEYLAKS
ncbi:MAG: DegT/DnrJ/EryC1/StrS family aminotransferase [Chitinophagales bacterium]